MITIARAVTKTITIEIDASTGFLCNAFFIPTTKIMILKQKIEILTFKSYLITTIFFPTLAVSLFIFKKYIQNLQIV